MMILIVDDHPIYAEGLKNLLESRGFGDAVLARNGAEAVECVKRAIPDVVLMDIAMPGMDGIRTTELIMAECPQAKIIMLTSLGDEESLFRAIAAGACGYLLKTLDGDELARCLVELRDGKNPFASTLEDRILSEFRRRGALPSRPRASMSSLSERQRKVLELLADGLTYKVIGSRLFISERTVKFHIRQIKDILRVESNEALVAFVRENR
jgi:two-component system NarL family response regulator